MYIVKLFLPGWMQIAGKARRAFVKSLYKEFDKSSIDCNYRDTHIGRVTSVIGLITLFSRAICLLQ